MWRGHSLWPMKTSCAGVVVGLVVWAGSAWAQAEGRGAGPGAAPAAAAGEAQEEAGFKVQPARLSLRVDAMAWYMGPGGDLDLPSTEALGDPDAFTIDGLGYDTPRFVVTPEFNVTWSDRWRLTLRGYYFTDSHDANAASDGQIGRVRFDAGDALHSNFRFGSYEAEVGYTWDGFPEKLAGVLDRDSFSTLEVVAGVRVFQVGWDLSRGAGPLGPADAAQSIDETFVQPMVGGRLACEFVRDMGLDAQVDIGLLPLGDGSNVSGDVIVGGWWKPWPHVGVQIGYRAAYFSLGSGAAGPEQFDFTGWNQGLQFGLVITF